MIDEPRFFERLIEYNDREVHIMTEAAADMDREFA